MRAKTLLAGVVLGAGLLAGTSNAMAQQSSPNATEDQGKATADQGKKAQNISEDKMNAVASALVDISRVRHDYEQRLAGASPEDRKRIADEGNIALEKAVTDKGLSVKEYDEIIEVAQNDPDFREKLIARASNLPQKQ